MMLRAIIAIILVFVFGYLIITSIQRLMDKQSDVDYYKSQIPVEEANFKSKGCTPKTFYESGEVKGAVKTWTCPVDTPPPPG